MSSDPCASLSAPASAKESRHGLRCSLPLPRGGYENRAGDGHHLPDPRGARESSIQTSAPNERIPEAFLEICDGPEEEPQDHVRPQLAGFEVGLMAWRVATFRARPSSSARSCVLPGASRASKAYQGSGPRWSARVPFASARRTPTGSLDRPECERPSWGRIPTSGRNGNAESSGTIPGDLNELEAFHLTGFMQQRIHEVCCEEPPALSRSTRSTSGARSASNTPTSGCAPGAAPPPSSP